MSLELDVSDLNRALREYRKVSRRDAAEIVNRTARDVVLRAIRHTPKADPTKIRQELTALGRSKREIAKRVRSVGYIKAGWVKAAQALGSKVGKVSERGRAARGGAKLASEGELTAEFINRATGAAVVGAAALQKAVNEVAFDKSEFAKKRMAETAKRFSS